MKKLLMCGKHKDCIVSYQAEEHDEDKFDEFDEEERDVQCPMCIIELKLIGMRANIKGILVLIGVENVKSPIGKKKGPKTRKEDDDE